MLEWHTHTHVCHVSHTCLYVSHHTCKSGIHTHTHIHTCTHTHTHTHVFPLITESHPCVWVMSHIWNRYIWVPSTRWISYLLLGCWAFLRDTGNAQKISKKNENYGIFSEYTKQSNLGGPTPEKHLCGSFQSCIFVFYSELQQPLQTVRVCVCVCVSV